MEIECLEELKYGKYSKLPSDPRSGHWVFLTKIYKNTNILNL